MELEMERKGKTRNGNGNGNGNGNAHDATVTHVYNKWHNFSILESWNTFPVSDKTSIGLRTSLKNTEVHKSTQRVLESLEQPKEWLALGLLSFQVGWNPFSLTLQTCFWHVLVCNRISRKTKPELFVLLLVFLFWNRPTERHEKQTAADMCAGH